MIKERIKSEFFISWMLLPIYLTNDRRDLLNNRGWDWSKNWEPWALSVFYLCFLLSIVPYIHKNIHHKIKKKYILFFHSSVLSLALTFSYIFEIFAKHSDFLLVPKIFIIWITPLILYFRQSFYK